MTLDDLVLDTWHYRVKSASNGAPITLKENLGFSKSMVLTFKEKFYITWNKVYVI